MEDIDTMEASVPGLRPGVRVEGDEGGGPGALFDAALGRRVRLDARGVAIARALDAEQPLATLAERADGTVEGVGRVVAHLARLHLLDTPTARTHAADAEALAALSHADPEEVPLLIRDDARFTCTMCGSCCGGHNIGPVFDDVLEGLSDHLDDLTTATRTAKGLFFELGDGDEARTLCHQSRGSCVFLDDDRRCRIHAAYGGDAKPRACRIFPYEFKATPRGVAVTIQRECRGFPEARHGRRLVDDEPAIRELLKLVPDLPAVRRVVSLAPGHTLTWDAYERLEASLHDAVDAHPEDATAALLAMRAIYREAAGEPPGPDPTGGADQAAALGDQLEAVARGIAGAAAQVKAAAPAPDDARWVRTESLDHLVAGLGALRPDWRRVVQPLARPDQRELFTEHLHHALMNKELASARSVRTGLARLNFGWLLAKAFAIDRARQVKRRHLVAQDIMDALVVTTFVMRHQDFGGPMLDHFGAAIEDLFLDRLPDMVADADAVPRPDRRTELVKF